ncbi:MULTISPECIES: hypothetical protein [unclassified Ruegeria]|uniref:hypothetical protein n=1 Tax=unclassified Ruegeria TaxID=2625375 RepID=UPI0014894442|nr:MULTISPECIES: hypothetical protein [unclassified Ruegeria]
MYPSHIGAHCSATTDLQRNEFAQKYPLLDDASVHAQWKNGSWQITRIGDIWKRTGKIMSVPHDGTDAFPSFQFAEDGTPLPLMEKVLKALPCEMTPWQRAYWMTSPRKELGGQFPAQCIRAGDERVVDAAGRAKGVPRD